MPSTLTKWPLLAHAECCSVGTSSWTEVGFQSYLVLECMNTQDPTLPSVKLLVPEGVVTDGDPIVVKGAGGCDAARPVATFELNQRHGSWEGGVGAGCFGPAALSTMGFLRLDWFQAASIQSRTSPIEDVSKL